MLEIFSGTSYSDLGKRICQDLGIKPGFFQRKEYSNSCFELIFQENLYGKIVFLIQTSLAESHKLHEQIWELLQMVNFCRSCGAKEIIAIMPYVSYSRSDKIHTKGMVINAELLVKLLEAAGITGFMRIDFHSSEFVKFFSSKVYHLSALDLLVQALKKNNLDDSFILPADKGVLEKSPILGKKLCLEVGRVEK